MKKSNALALPAIDGPELMRLTQSGVIADASHLRRDMIRALGAMNPAALVSLAMSLVAGQWAPVALEALKSKAAQWIDELTVSGEELHAVVRAEQHRLAGVVAAAAHRSLEILDAVNGIDARIRSGANLADGKRERLSKAGLSGGDLDRAATPFDASELLAQRAAMLVENEALESFLRTRDVRCLPEGFAAEVEAA